MADVHMFPIADACVHYHTADASPTHTVIVPFAFVRVGEVHGRQAR